MADIEGLVRGKGEETTGKELLGDKLAVNVEYSPDNTDLTLTGVFVFRRPNVGDRLDIPIARARLLQGAPVQSIPEDDFEFIDAIATCMTVIESKPDWFILNGKDANVGRDLVVSLYREYNSYLVEYFRQREENCSVQKKKPVLEISRVVLGKDWDSKGKG